MLEGIAFNHRTHVDALRERFEVRTVRLTGGVSRNPRVAQLFSDVLGAPVTVPAIDEAAAFGAAACAGVAVGAFDSIAALPDPGAGAARVHAPDPARVAEADERFGLYERVGAAIAPTLAGAGGPRGHRSIGKAPHAPRPVPVRRRLRHHASTDADDDGGRAS